MYSLPIQACVQLHPRPPLFVSVPGSVIHRFEALNFQFPFPAKRILNKAYLCHFPFRIRAGNMSERKESESEVFQTLQKDFINLIDLATLVPQLNAKSLLTSDEEYKLTYQETPPGQRKIFLTQILRSKGHGTPHVVLECLRAETLHRGHAELAEKLSSFLAREDGTCHGDDDTISSPACASPAMASGLHDATTLQSLSSNFHGEDNACAPMHFGVLL